MTVLPSQAAARPEIETQAGHNMHHAPHSAPQACSHTPTPARCASSSCSTAPSPPAGTAQLSPSQAIQAAWALASLGADKEAAGPLLAAAAKQVAAAPDSLEPSDIAALYEAATISGAAVPPQVGCRWRHEIFSAAASGIVPGRLCLAGLALGGCLQLECINGCCTAMPLSAV